jgi:hypothetical protein
MVARGRCGDPVLSRSRLVVECRLRRLLETGRPVYRRPVSHSGPLRGHLVRLTPKGGLHIGIAIKGDGPPSSGDLRDPNRRLSRCCFQSPWPLRSMSCYDRTRRARPSGSYGSAMVSVSLRSATPSRTVEPPVVATGPMCPQVGRSGSGATQRAGDLGWSIPRGGRGSLEKRAG